MVGLNRQSPAKRVLLRFSSGGLRRAALSFLEFRSAFFCGLCLPSSPTNPAPQLLSLRTLPTRHTNIARGRHPHHPHNVCS